MIMKKLNSRCTGISYPLSNNITRLIAALRNHPVVIQEVSDARLGNSNPARFAARGWRATARRRPCALGRHVPLHFGFADQFAEHEAEARPLRPDHTAGDLGLAAMQ